MLFAFGVCLSMFAAAVIVALAAIGGMTMIDIFFDTHLIDWVKDWFFEEVEIEEES